MSRRIVTSAVGSMVAFAITQIRSSIGEPICHRTPRPMLCRCNTPRTCSQAGLSMQAIFISPSHHKARSGHEQQEESPRERGKARQSACQATHEKAPILCGIGAVGGLWLGGLLLLRPHALPQLVDRILYALIISL